MGFTTCSGIREAWRDAMGVEAWTMSEKDAIMLHGERRYSFWRDRLESAQYLWFFMEWGYRLVPKEDRYLKCDNGETNFDDPEPIGFGDCDFDRLDFLINSIYSELGSAGAAIYIAESKYLSFGLMGMGSSRGATDEFKLYFMFFKACLNRIREPSFYGPITWYQHGYPWDEKDHAGVVSAMMKSASAYEKFQKGKQEEFIRMNSYKRIADARFSRNRQAYAERSSRAMQKIKSITKAMTS
jgi:hypothetical protein